VTELIYKVIDYFFNDPLKILYLIGGTGGIYFWYEKWTSRVRLHTVLVKQTYDPDNNFGAELKFKCTNVGSKITSLDGVVTVVSLTRDGLPLKVSMQIMGNDLALKPHEAREFLAKGPVGATYYFSKYRKYQFKLNYGSSCNLYTLDGPIESEKSFFKWVLDKQKFKIKLRLSRLIQRATNT
jgi:hypothetical protein